MAYALCNQRKPFKDIGETSMKLYDVPRNSRIAIEDGSEFNFHHIDGMYSFCTDDSGNVVHLAAWTEVTICENN
jgi:hypothetical protein